MALVHLCSGLSGYSVKAPVCSACVHFTPPPPFSGHGQKAVYVGVPTKKFEV